jgi:hypothetical protein
MKVAVVTSVSENIAEMAALTVPNKLAYCLRHGYSLVVNNESYQDAVMNWPKAVAKLLDSFDLVWCLDSDAVITDLDRPIHSLPGLGPCLTVCEEGIVDWNRINCGSTVWMSGSMARYLLSRIDECFHEWEKMPCQQQTWLGVQADRSGDLIKVAPLRSFNSCAWNHDGDDIKPRSHWQPGDFVFHPCGVFPHSQRLVSVRAALEMVGTKLAQ